MHVYGKYSTREPNTVRGKAECCICFKTPPSAVFFIHTSIGSALSVILYFLVIWLGAIYFSTQTAAIFGDQDISKCLYNLFLVIERTNRNNLASFSDLQFTHVINCAVLVESCLKNFAFVIR